MFFSKDLKSTYRGRYINVGCPVGDENSYLWTISANEEAENTPLVLVHGFGSGVGLWCLNIDSLSAKRPVYAFDVLGNRYKLNF